MKDESIKNNIEIEMDNKRNLKSSFSQDYEMLALHAYQQTHRQLQLNPFKDAVVAYQILNTNRVMIVQVNHFIDSWNNKSLWSLSMIIGTINPIDSEFYNESIGTQSFRHLENIDKIHRLARIDARQSVEKIDDLTKEMFLELTEQFIRNFNNTSN